jgi:hypothetical protein
MMQKRIFSLAFAAVLGLGLTGCVGKTGAGIPETKQLQRMEPKTVTFNFPTKDSVTGENIQFDLSSQNFSNNIAGYSRFPAFRATRYGAVTDYSGLKVEKKQDSYTIKYANGELNTGFWYLTEAIFDIKYSVSNNQITFMYPASYVYQPFANAIGIGIDPLAPKASMEADVASIYSKLDNLVVSFNKSYAYKGEVNTKYPDKAIYANFKRILGNYNWQAKDKLTDVKKENTFALNFKGQTFPLVVEVFPYRDGSKVIYSSSIQYTIDSKGNCSASKADIDELNKKIEKIIND